MTGTAAGVGARPTCGIVGSKGSVTVAGTSFRAALGLRSEWWSVLAKPVQPTWPPPVPTSAVVQTVPSAPSGVRVSAADRSASVSWRSPTDDGNAAITGYRVTVSPGGQAVDLAASKHTLTVHGLVNGTTYTVSVSAKNAKGSSSQGKRTVVPTSPYTAYVPVAFTPARTLRGPARASGDHQGRVACLLSAPAPPLSGSRRTWQRRSATCG